MAKRNLDRHQRRAFGFREWPLPDDAVDEWRMYQQMGSDVDAFDTVQYAGHIFKTARTQRGTKVDNSNVRMPFHVIHNNRRVLRECYGSIRNIFTHTMYPGGPTRCILEVDWFTQHGTASSGNPLVDTRNSEDHTFAFIEDCYQMPVAVWPHDPLGELEPPFSGYSEVIDRNQTEIA